jgi:hydrogenase nickel incorporation protein HypB
MKIKLMDRVLEANDAWAEENRKFLAARGAVMFNLIGSPGAGKTTLLEKTIGLLAEKAGIAVIEGDVATSRDAERIGRAGAPVVQINTGDGCHLGANAVNAALNELCAAGAPKVVFVENVGNLICPAEFDLGEWAKIAVLSVAEGDDKVEKYPLLFSLVRALVITKTGLLPHTNFRMAEAEAQFRRINRDAPIFALDSLSGDGVGPWMEFVGQAASISTTKARRTRS